MRGDCAQMSAPIRGIGFAQLSERYCPLQHAIAFNERQVRSYHQLLGRQRLPHHRTRVFVE